MAIKKRKKNRTLKASTLMRNNPSCEAWHLEVYRDSDWPMPEGWHDEGYFWYYTDAKRKLEKLVKDDPRITKFVINSITIQ